MPLSPRLAEWLGHSGHDAVHASSIGLHSADDSVILESARSEDRIVLTADLDYPRLLALSKAEGPGVILFRGGNFAEEETARLLSRALEIVPHSELHTSIVTIEHGRIRRRRLPISPDA
jgi:predicted nuclease of predicted toxin-antitoxin system